MRFSHRSLAVAVTVILAAAPTLPAAAGPAPDDCPPFSPAGAVGTVGPALGEVSDVVPSRRQPGVVWAHNDSGHPAELHALTETGAPLGTFTWDGAVNVDWEDAAVTDDAVYVGDIGDNGASRPDVTIYRVPEPDVDALGGDAGAHSVTGVEAVDVTYPDEAHNAETLLVDPVTGDLFVVTKTAGTTEVFRLAAPFAAGTAEFELVATVPFGTVTGGDITPSGDAVVLLNYGDALLWRRSGGTVAEALAGMPTCLPIAGTQTEALGFLADGHGYLMISDFQGAPGPVPVYRFDQTQPWPFADVPVTAWYEPAVRALAARGVATGFPGGDFRPRAVVTRGQAMGWLWKVAGSPDAPPEDFDDVPDGAWYADAVGWAVDGGVATGFPGGAFRPRAVVTRGQAVGWLWKLAESPDAPPEDFDDVPDGAWYADAVGWAVDAGVATGFPGDQFRPRDGLRRGTTAAWLTATPLP